MLDRRSLVKIFILAATMTTVSLYFFLNNVNGDIVYAHTMVLATLTILQIYNVFNIKSGDKSIFKVSIFNNKYLLSGIFVSVFMFLFAMYNPFLQNILEIRPISFSDWSYVLVAGLILVFVEELRKLFFK